MKTVVQAPHKRNFGPGFLDWMLFISPNEQLKRTQNAEAVTDKPARCTASWRMCCIQIWWTLSVIN